MLIIGERINATRSDIKNAILNRDSELIRKEARDQAEAGADYIDVNGGTTPEEELDNMLWLCEVVQSAVSAPLCIDSASPSVIEAGLKRHRNGRAMVNSISMEAGKHESILPLVSEHKACVVALAMDDSGIPRTAEDRLRVVERTVEEAGKHSIPLCDVYVDPLVMALSSDAGAGLMVIEVLEGIHRRWPELRTTCGLSNISFGLPDRRLINRIFSAMLMAHGLDSAILDPLDKEMTAAIIGGRALLGRDEFCMEYIKAFRAGRL
jgi:5-methyltetrahydrofolate--homocysteine methyltransferase